MNQISNQDISKLPHISQVRFALFCARQVSHLVKKEHKVIVDRCIEVVDKWLIGEATQEECRAAAYAAHAAAAAYAAYAAAAAAYAAYAAADAAYAAAAAAAADAANKTPKTIADQWEYYEELLHFDDMFDRVVLG